MNNLKEPRIFETQNVDLASYLMLEGIKLLECKKSEANKKVVILRFLDEKENCLDLERIWLNSPFKQYRDINKYLLSKVHETVRST
jgi:Domain of unknown function (DUF5659)